MPRVKCPHCGAGNQDATEQDTCWQCGQVLGAPVERAEAGARVIVPQTTGVPTRQLDPAAVPRALEPELPPAEAGPRSLVVVLSIAVMVIAVLVIALFLFTGR